MLGSTLTLTNKSVKTQSFTVYISSEFPKDQSVKQLLDQYYMEDLPFKAPHTDVENLYKAWSIEQPHTKQLMSKITIELQPQEAQTLVVVLKSPTLQRTVNMMSFLKVTTGKSFMVKQIESGKR